MTNRIARYMVAAALCACLLASAVMCGSLTYSSQRKLIRAGVLTFAPGAMPNNPFLFYVMDQRLDIKPAGWEFINPLALSSNKAQPAYWEVSMNATFEDFAKFDVLFLAAPVGSTITFSREDREKLRKFVDAGGVLWIENGGGGLYGAINFAEFFISNIDFGAIGARPSKGLTPAHPLLARPFTLTWQEINNLGFSGRIGTTVTGAPDALPDVRYFSTIIADNAGKPLVSGAQYGSGHIVLCGEPVSQAISAGASNSAGLIAAQPEDLKLGFNIVNWGSEYTTFHKDSRHTGYSFAEVGAPLAKLWEYPDKFSPNSFTPGDTFSSPVILDDMVFFVDHGGILHAFDLSLSRDRDMNGIPDDGIVDQSIGAPYDEIWSAKVGVGASLTAAYVPLGGSAVPGIAAVALDGTVLGFDAGAAKTNNPQSISLFTAKPFSAFSAIPAAPSLVYSDGGLYGGDGQGSLHGRNFFSGGPDWATPPIGTTEPVVGSPTVGYVYDRVSGAVEQDVFLPRQALAGGVPGVQVFPMKVFNEILTSDAEGAGVVPLMSRRSMGCSIKAGKYQLYVPTSTGRIDISANVTLPPQPGTFQVDMTALDALGLLGKPILADYETDPAGVAFNPRSTITIKTNPNPSSVGQGVSCTPALSADDVLFFGTDNGSLYAAQESADPDPRRALAIRTEVRWRSSLLDPTLLGLLGGATTAAPPIALGSPCVGDGMAYFTVRAPNNDSYLMAFKSAPLFEINVGTMIQPGSTIEFQQDDSMNPGTEPVRLVYNPADRTTRDWVDVNYASGLITIRNFRPTGTPQRDLSSTQDIVVSFVRPVMAGGDGRTRESQIHYAWPQLNGAQYLRANPLDKWNNLAWCVKLPFPATSSPMVYGSKLFIGMTNGELASIDVNKAKSAAASLDLNTVTNGRANLGVMLPWNEALGYMWEIPVSPGNASPIYATAAGSNGVLAVASANGLTVLYNPVTLVADGNRVAEFDAGGDVLWSCDATTAIAETTTGTGAANGLRYSASSVPFNRPAVARRTDIGGIVVADTGNNRVVLIDTGGQVLWEIKDFTDPNNIMPTGMALTLSKPQDVNAWTQWDATGIPEYHFLIADTGNFRILDVVAKWDDALQAFKNVLGWVSKTVFEGKQYLYTSARLMPDASNWNRWVIMAIVSNQQAAVTGMESPGGSLVKLHYVPFDPLNPAATGVGEMLGNPYTQLPIDIVAPAQTWLLQNPSFFTRVYKTQTDYTDVVIDANGLHVVEYSAAGQAIRNYRPVDHQAAADRQAVAAGQLTTVRPLSASYAQVLPNGNILVTNKAIGQVAGEVFELVWNPNLLPAPGYDIAWPAANVRFGANSFGLRQPSSAERQVF